MTPRRDCKVRRGAFFLLLFRFHLPVSLFENETLLFDPGPPALGAHPLPCVDHSGWETYKEDGERCISNTPVRVRTFVRLAICRMKVHCRFRGNKNKKGQSSSITCVYTPTPHCFLFSFTMNQPLRALLWWKC